ncbi:hypothetical protein ABBQ32_003774 [Trebouxia sp. C0010 RCD-2024]
MGTWAAVTRLDAPKAAPLVQKLDSANISVAVVDTNAVISGVQLHRIADTAVTIPEVLSEVRDKNTRQALANLPFALECKEPTEESVKAVLRFARATGDLHSLSVADIRLIALAHTLQLARHGEKALRPLPELPYARKGNAPAAKELPGWNETGDKWADMDKLTEDDLAEQELAGLLSKVSHAVQHLDISSDSQQVAPQQASEQLSTSPDSVLESASTATHGHASGTTAHYALPQPAISQHHSMPDDSEDWHRASSSHNAARKKKRKQHRRAVLQPDPAPSAPTINASAYAALPPLNAPAQADQAVCASGSSEVVISNAEEQAVVINPQHEEPSTAAVTGVPSQPATAQPDQSNACASSYESANSDSESAQEEEDSESETTASIPGESQAAESAAGDTESDDDESSSEAVSADEPAFGSSVASVTADFAMQNVILQMGLRLVAPNGMRIKQLSRWVLRCSACFKITKEPGRLFCPHCGNATLDKVEAVIGADGTEQYGVRKRFNTRGTRYSLPKPKVCPDHPALDRSID